MAYRNKTYVCFDADSDIRYYNLMKAWKENDSMAFDFYNAHEINNLRDGSSEAQIKRKLRERLQNTKVLVILIGKVNKEPLQICSLGNRIRNRKKHPNNYCEFKQE